MRHVVRDEHDREPTIAHATDQLEHLRSFLHAECRRGLVHDHDVLCERGTARDGHALSLSTRQRLHRLRHRADPDSQLREIRGAFTQHSRLVEHPQYSAQHPAAAQLATQKKILRDRHCRRDRQLLINRFDPRPSRIERFAKVHTRAVQIDLAAVGHQCPRQRLDQRRLSGAVVPDHRENLAVAQLKVGAVECRDVPVAFYQPDRLHHDLRCDYRGVRV